MNKSTLWRRRAAGCVVPAMLAMLSATATAQFTGSNALHIANVNSGLCVQPAPDPNPYLAGLPMVQEPCTHDWVQLWLGYAQGTGSIPGLGNVQRYHLMNSLTGQCLDLRDGNTADQAILQQWPCNSTSTTMLWSIQYQPGGWEFRNARSGKCLDIAWASAAPGASAWQYHCSSVDWYPNYAQRFNLWFWEPGA